MLILVLLLFFMFFLVVAGGATWWFVFREDEEDEEDEEDSSSDPTPTPPSPPPTEKQKQCELGEWIKSGECKNGIQGYVRSIKGYCPENPETTKDELCCTTGNWLGTGKCEGEYEEQYRSLSKGCSSDVPKNQKVITTFCKDAEAERKLMEKKELDEAEKKRIQELNRERAKALAIKQQKAKEAAKAEELKKRTMTEEAKNAKRKAQECADKSWNGTVLSSGYHTYVSKDKELVVPIEYGDIKIDVNVGKTKVGKRYGVPVYEKDYRKTETTISFAKYSFGKYGGRVFEGYVPIKTYNGRLFISDGKLMLRKYTTMMENGSTKEEIIAEFSPPDKHALILMSFGSNQHVWFIRNNSTRVYDLVEGKWIDNPYSC
jgi:hypothetical protein